MKLPIDLFLKRYKSNDTPSSEYQNIKLVLYLLCIVFCVIVCSIILEVTCCHLNFHDPRLLTGTSLSILIIIGFLIIKWGYYRIVINILPIIFICMHIFSVVSGFYAGFSMVQQTASLFWPFSVLVYTTLFLKNKMLILIGSLYVAFMLGLYWIASSSNLYPRIEVLDVAFTFIFSIFITCALSMIYIKFMKNAAAKIHEEEIHRCKLETKLLQSQKLESIGQLAGGVAHDFNNMLGVILGGIGLMRLQYNMTEDMLADLANIEKAALHSKEITSQLLAFSRKQLISPELVNLNDLIRYMQSTFSSLISEDIRIHYELSSDLWNVSMDKTQFNQVLINLVSNAHDAILGKGEISVKTGNNEYLSEEKISPGLIRKPGQYVALSVSDNGCGMDKETFEHLFEPFFTTKEPGRGTGLGLATVFSIVKQNNGYIHVNSQLGVGTTFTVYLPGKDDQLLSQKANSVDTVSKKANILVVEDNVLIRKITKTMLEKHGHRVFIANSPATAISLCKNSENRIDILLSDVIMPGMSGPELETMMRRIIPDIKVLFMSGYTSTIIQKHGCSQERKNFIQKPFTYNELTSKISEII